MDSVSSNIASIDVARGLNQKYGEKAKKAIEETIEGGRANSYPQPRGELEP
jgi:hypothetical protein